MAVEKVEPAQAGEKRKFSVYSSDFNDMEQFFASTGENFTVPASLLDKHGRLWREGAELGHADQNYKGYPHYFPSDHPCVVRGFLHWLYTGKMPTTSLIREQRFPSNWGLGAEADPVEMCMALELYRIGWCFGTFDLCNVTMTTIFGLYKASGMFPNVDRLGDIDECIYQHPFNFVLDLYLKRCPKWTKSTKYPDNFLHKLLNRMRERDPAGKSISGPLRLSDYHIDTPLHDETCSCKNPDAGEECFIK